MTGFDPKSLNWLTGLLAGWTYDKSVNKWFQGQFRNAHRITRECPTCRGTVALEVTTKALLGEATNHGLALRRCRECRKALKHDPQEYAERKATGTERTETPAAVPAEVVAELEQLRMVNKVMKEELDGFYAAVHKKQPWE